MEKSAVSADEKKPDNNRQMKSSITFSDIKKLVYLILINYLTNHKTPMNQNIHESNARIDVYQKKTDQSQQFSTLPYKNSIVIKIMHPVCVH